MNTIWHWAILQTVRLPRFVFCTLCPPYNVRFHYWCHVLSALASPWLVRGTTAIPATLDQWRSCSQKRDQRDHFFSRGESQFCFDWHYFSWRREEEQRPIGGKGRAGPAAGGQAEPATIDPSLRCLPGWLLSWLAGCHCNCSRADAATAVGAFRFR